MPLSFADLLQRRLVFTVGKGGVGRTTVTLGIALEAARRGHRVLVVELEGARGLEAALATQREQVHPPAWLDRIEYMMVDGRRALEEYLGLIVPVKRLLKTVFSSNVYQYFVAAAPGLKELMTVGKVWYEATREEGRRPAWDVVVVDAPATGHGLQYLRMPHAARDTFGAGLVQREASRIVGVLQDPRVTAVHLVTLAEDMPATEALEAHAQLTGPLGLPMGAVVVNRVHDRRFTPEVIARLRAAAATTAEADRALLASVAERAVEEGAWAEINAQHLARLRDALGGAPLVVLPYLFTEEFGEHELDTLAGILGEATTRAAVRRA